MALDFEEIDKFEKNLDKEQKDVEEDMDKVEKGLDEELNPEIEVRVEGK